MKRDMTQAQFDAAIERNGIKREWLGYYAVNTRLRVYAANAGTNRRAQLAYLIREQAADAASEEQANEESTP